MTLAVGDNGHTGAIGNLNSTAGYVARHAVATARYVLTGEIDLAAKQSFHV